MQPPRTSPTSPIAEIGGNCLAVRARMLARTLSAIYDRAMAHQGVTISQVNIMVYVGHHDACQPSDIGKGLAMERSTVSRNIRPLLEHGWLDADTASKGRLRSVRLTSLGQKKVASLLPSWRRAQDQAATLLGNEGTTAVRHLGDRLWQRTPRPTT